MNTHSHDQSTSGENDKANGPQHWESADVPTEVFVRMNRDDDEIAKIREFTEALVKAHLEKFGTRISHVSVRFEDINGPRGGRDIACQVHVTVPHTEPTVIEKQGEAPEQALLFTLEAVEKALERHYQYDSNDRRSARRIRTGQTSFENADSLAL